VVKAVVFTLAVVLSIYLEQELRSIACHLAVHFALSTVKVNLL
jgi:hypothetical protein